MKSSFKILIFFAVNIVAAFLLIHSVTTYVPSVGVSKEQQAAALYLSLAINIGVIFFVAFKMKPLSKPLRFLAVLPALLFLIIGILIIQGSLLDSLIGS